MRLDTVQTGAVVTDIIGAGILSLASLRLGGSARILNGRASCATDAGKPARVLSRASKRGYSLDSPSKEIDHD